MKTEGAQLDLINTLAVPSQAETVWQVHSEDDLLRLAPLARASGMVVLGGGSNVVLGQRIDRPVCLIRSRGIKVEQRGGKILVTAAAGENWHALVRWSLGQGYSGLENLALIPGSVGAAPVQNIGAYGLELANRLVWLTALEVETGKLLQLSVDECEFGYRSSLFKRNPGNFVIADVTFALNKAGGRVETGYTDVGLELERMGTAHPRAIDVAEAVVRIRRRKLPDPRFIPNAGSFFKNPVIDEQMFGLLRTREPDLKSYSDTNGIKLAAAQLIARCASGSSAGIPQWARPDAPIHVWQRQPLVLTNPGRCSAERLLAVAREIQDAVEARFGIRLELEPDTVGC